MYKKRLAEIFARKREIANEIDGADETRMSELENELKELEAEERSVKQKLDLSERLGEPEGKPQERGGQLTEREKRAQAFAEKNRISFNTRSLLTTTSGIANPTKVQQEINDMYGVEVSSIVDMVTSTDCTGMGTYKVPIITAGLTASAKTDGTAVDASDITVSSVDLTPNAFNVLSYVSKMLKKQTSVMYETKVVQAARTALRKKASKAIVDAIYASSLCVAKVYAKDATNGVAVGEKTLREIAFAYGGDEGIGGGVLILNKTDLIAFGDVRGTAEKKAVYEIIPDSGNENTGIIKDGGLSVRYVINSNCAAFNGCKTASTKTMIYGNPRNCELASWGDVEISTSEDYKFAEGLLSVLGEALIDADVVVKNGFVVVATGA